MKENMDFTPFDIACYNDLKKRFEFLFEPKLINEICHSGNLKVFQAEEMLIDIGMLITHLPIVVSGSIKILTEDKDGMELLLYYLETGDTCAVTLNCCTKKAKSTITAIAETKAEVIFVPIEKMEEWMVRYKSWRNYVLESYNERLNEMLSAIDNIVFNSMEQRLEKYIRDKVLISKSATLNLTHQEIARDLHSSRVVISRLMKKLENNNIIKQSRNKIIVQEFVEESLK